MRNATNYDQILWTTSGDGSFDDVAILNPVYTPGDQDILAGTVTLTIDVTSIFACNDASDDVVVLIDHAPTADAGEDFTVCFPGEINLNGPAARRVQKGEPVPHGSCPVLCH